MKNIILTLFGSSLLLLMSCDENSFKSIVEIDLPKHESALSINSHLIADNDSIGVYVSHSLGILDSATYDLIPNAKVELYKNGDFFHELEADGNKGFYKKLGIDPLGTNKDTYRLEVTAPNYKSVSAEQTMPSPVNVGEIEFAKDAAINGDGEKADELRITIIDPPGEENYYSFYVFFEPDPNNIGDSYSYSLYSDDIFVEYGSEGMLLRDATFDGQNYILRFISYNYDGYEPKTGDKFVISIGTITKDRYLYERTKIIYQDSQDNPFSEPVVVHENIQDGHGIFSLGVNSEKVFEF